MRGRALGLVLLLALPVAAGAPVAGSFLSRGSVVLDDAALRGPASLLFLPSSTDVQAFSIVAEEVFLTRYEATYARVDGFESAPRLRTGISESSFRLHNVTLQLEGVSPGWLGARWGEAVAEMPTAGSLELSAVEEARVGNGLSGDDPTIASVDYSAPGPLLMSTPSAAVSVDGAGELKWIGLNVTWTADENASSLHSGWEALSPTSERQTWVILGGNQLTLNVRTSGAFDLALASGASSSRALRFAASQGELAGEGASYTIPSSGEVVLSGELRSTLLPQQGGVVGIEVEGDLDATTLSAVAPVMAMDRLAWIGLVVLGAVVAGLAGFGVAQRRSRQYEPGPEDAAELAATAADAEDYRGAVRWIQHARKQSPSSARLLLEEAYYLWKAGDREGARERLREAGQGNDGEAEILHARLLVDSGDPAAAREELKRALEKAPILLLEVELDDELMALASEESTRNAVLRARRRMQAEDR